MSARLFWLCVGSILYTYAGYPLLVTLLARLRSRPREYPRATPAVTLLIAAYNEEAAMAAKLDNSLTLDYPRDRLQILVADDGSVDRTAEIVRAYAGHCVELCHHFPRRGKMAAINQAMRQARGEIVILSDAHNFYAPNVVRELVAPFVDPSVGAVAGAHLVIEGDGALGASEGLYWRYESFIKEQETRLGCCTAVTGDILAIRRDQFERPPEGIINDDFYIPMRLIRRGYRVIYTPRARSWEHVAPTARDEMARRARIVAGRYQAITLAHRLLPLHRPLIVWQVVSHKFLRPLVPLAMAGALLANLVAVVRPVRRRHRRLVHLAPPVNWIILALQMIFYGLAWLGTRVERRGFAGTLLYVPTYLVNSNLAAVMGLFRFLTRQQTPLWERVQRWR
ncbi:MAG TPA: glycosyltransferase family 2 protein [Ardenticatenaceae bacterium]|nr:glycosyltransferase family 2 protein [Ardenticatenaceae bacterium]